jgi:hypothetical protein
MATSYENTKDKYRNFLPGLIQVIETQRVEFIAVRSTIDAAVKGLEGILIETARIVADKFHLPPNLILVSVQAGMYGTDWTPTIYIRLDKYGVGASDPPNTPIIGLGVPLSDVNAAITELESIIGAPITIECVFRQPAKRVRREGDVYDVYGKDAKVLAQGKIWYKGWDVPDVWFVVRRPDGQVIYLASQDGHGGYAVEYTGFPGSPGGVEEFFTFIETDSDNEGIREILLPEIR